MNTVLIVGTEKEITDVILRLVNDFDGFEGVVVSDLTAFEEVITRDKIDVVLIGAGFSDESEAHVRNRVKEVNDKIAVVEHYGGGSGLLFSELLDAVKK